MPITTDDLNSFHHFAITMVTAGAVNAGRRTGKRLVSANVARRRAVGTTIVTLDSKR